MLVGGLGGLLAVEMKLAIAACGYYIVGGGDRFEVGLLNVRVTMLPLCWEISYFALLFLSMLVAMIYSIAKIHLKIISKIVPSSIGAKHTDYNLTKIQYFFLERFSLLAMSDKVDL